VQEGRSQVEGAQKAIERESSPGNRSKNQRQGKKSKGQAIDARLARGNERLSEGALKRKRIRDDRASRKKPKGKGSSV